MRHLLLLASLSMAFAGCDDAFEGSQNEDCVNADDCDDGQECIALDSGGILTCQIACTEASNVPSSDCPDHQECTDFDDTEGGPFYCYPGAQ